ncbi:ABC transporter ATP-binding protein/permease [Paenibacillus alvei]|uniref:ABC transporter ATP-binding protein n=1 Tax=Paenibacillus TaxID=44249 RepID=UPI0021D10F42|nr:ABC transporter ATP-binding protein [Paenibacillus alvei]MCY9541686.1 ABC transporter ATP-binding protein/permease [Paenibacillus alvei]MCY9704172.1 ABC transporter ATP-binding protein/permease [Paenibacillus alvei]MCY9736899.1 ABC transporter ATP-binding protein/permease [Paenibacillus alvei]MEC0079289.1 ABC transporter ATP-binding protein [Paenibacillus alvei]
MSRNTSLSMSWLLRYVIPVRGRLLFLLVMLLVSTAFQLVNPQIVQQFIDTAASQGTLSTLLLLAGLYLIIAALTQLITVAISYLGNDISWRATNTLRADLLKHCLGLDMHFHNRKTPGEMIERIDGDVTGMSNFFAMFIVQVIGSFILLAGILGFMFTVNWPIALAMAIFTLLSIGFMTFIRNMGVSSSKDERAASASLFGLIEERIAGIEDVQANGAVPYVINRFHQAMHKVFRTGRKAWMLRVVPWNTTVVLFAIAVTVVLLLGVHYYLIGQISLGTLFLIFQYTQMLNTPIEQLGDQIQEFQKAKSGMMRSQEILSLQSEIVDGTKEQLPDGALGLEFDHVTFGYNEEKVVLHDITFAVQPGQRLGIIGRTGSGKSSISRLLLRLYNIDSGIIRIGGEDIRSLKLETLYRRVGMVTQDVQLFDGTLRDNLTLFDPEITDESIFETTDRLGLRQWIDALPNGLDSHLSSGGTSLSAGEAQLFALTRVFLTNPSIIVLDEPSSRLDAATEAMLQTAVDQLMEQCTGIIIAHRLATLEQVDAIMVLQHGRIVELGPREELASDPSSHYAMLLRTGREEELA